MIKVLIVDDEKLVRKGIIGMMPWEKYNMVVVGEAHSGKSTLEFIETHDVDLLMTDLYMPGLSGIEYIGKVRELYPNLLVVIFTFHQDFEIIQQALRLGVIDYITKAQIETENVDGLLARVHKRINKEKLVHKHYNKPLASFDRALLLYKAPVLVREILTNIVEGISGTIDYSNNIVLFPDIKWIQIPLEDRNKLEKCCGGILIQLENTLNLHIDSILQSVECYVLNELFYVYKPDTWLYKIDFNGTINETSGTIESVSIQCIAEVFQSMTWIHNDLEWDKLIQEILLVKPSKDIIKSIVYTVSKDWSHYLQSDYFSYFNETARFMYWFQWKEWLEDYRVLLRNIISSDKSSRQITECIQKAISFINFNYNQDMILEDVLAVANMSKSYFSVCFKNFTNMTYSEYIRSIRLDKAKELLLKTEKPVHWIAEQCGYPNVKYFHKVFKESTGFQPKTYRMTYRGSK